MSKQILINSSSQETRIALMEEDRIMELFFERHSDKGIVGNIYKAKVLRVLPGMQAAFLDIGHERAAFLYAGDFINSRHNSEDLDDEDGDDEPKSNRRGGRSGGRRRSRRRQAEDVPPIAELVKEGQELLVQVAKGPIAAKGARVTCHISLPGRFAVFMPSLKHNGVSRKIENYDLRKKLKKVIDQFKAPEGGFIIRTAAGSELNEKHIRSDVDYLQNLWNKINRKFKSSPAPRLLHYDLDLTTRMIRDHLDDDIEYLIVDNKLEHKKILRFIRNFNPELKNKVELYQDPIPLFDRFNVEQEMNKALGKRVWLKSGGYLIIEHTEALTSIDINTGRFVGKKTLEETILKTNMEAAEELVRQLRLRNIGGIIIIDFIDMEKESSKEQVYRYLEKLVEDDRQKTTILKISNLGLVEMTRKRARTPLHRQLAEECRECDGRGYIKSAVTVAHQALRDIRRELPHCEDDHMYVTLAPAVYEVMIKEEKATIVELEKRFQKGIKLQSDSNFHQEQIGITPTNAPKLKGAKLEPLAFMQKLPEPENYFMDDDDRRDDEAEYQADVKEIQAVRDEHLRKIQEAAERARSQSASTLSQEPAPSEETELSQETDAFDSNDENDDLDEDQADAAFESPVIRQSIASETPADEEDEDEDEEEDSDDEEHANPPSDSETKVQHH